MVSSVGGRRPEDLHRNRHKGQHICTKNSRGSLPPAAEKEREEEMGKRRAS